MCVFVGWVCKCVRARGRERENESSVKIWFTNKSVCAVREDGGWCCVCDCKCDKINATVWICCVCVCVSTSTTLLLLLFYTFALRANGNATAFYVSFICTFPCVCVRPHFIHIFTSHIGMECVCALVCFHSYSTLVVEVVPFLFQLAFPSNREKTHWITIFDTMIFHRMLANIHTVFGSNGNGCVKKKWQQCKTYHTRVSFSASRTHSLCSCATVCQQKKYWCCHFLLRKDKWKNGTVNICFCLIQLHWSFRFVCTYFRAVVHGCVRVSRIFVAQCCKLMSSQELCVCFFVCCFLIVTTYEILVH